MKRLRKSLPVLEQLSSGYKAGIRGRGYRKLRHLVTVHGFTVVGLRFTVHSFMF